MNKGIIVCVTAAALSAAITGTAFAGTWERNGRGWWYASNDSGSEWFTDGWYWIDGNGDGIAECYRFNQSGYMEENSSPDGYTVNADGQWAVGGVIQTKPVSPFGSSKAGSASNAQEYAGDHVLVCFREGTSEDRIRRIADQTGCVVDAEYGSHFGFYLFRIKSDSSKSVPEVCAELSEGYPEVISGQPDYIMHIESVE